MVSIDFVSLTTRPTGVVTPISDPMIAKVGDRLGHEVNISFADGWSIGNCQKGYYVWGDYTNALDGYYGNWKISGTYTIRMVAQSDNICMGKTIKAVVTEKNGTMKATDYVPFGTVAYMPAGITKIESEAFAGTKFTEVDIPAGVTISNDAFAGTGLIAVYAHDQNTIDWAVSNGFIAITD